MYVNTFGIVGAVSPASEVIAAARLFDEVPGGVTNGTGTVPQTGVSGSEQERYDEI